MNIILETIEQANELLNFGNSKEKAKGYGMLETLNKFIGTNVYYTIDKETTNLDGFSELNGNKTISIYIVFNNELNLLGDVDTTNDVNTVDAIVEYFIENQLATLNVNFKQL